MTEYKKAFIDTAPFIYYIEGNLGNPKYAGNVKTFLMNSYNNGVPLVSSAITVEEYMVYPYRNNDKKLEDAFMRLIDILEIDMIKIDEKTALKAAKIRADYKTFKAMYSLQLASACLSGCDIFLTNDKQIRQFTEIKCITVDEIEFL